MKRCTAIPTAAVAHLLASGAVSGGGAAPPEAAVPRDAFMGLVRERGIDIRERWHEGHVPVSEASAS